jgi:hypothetical protein
MQQECTMATDIVTQATETKVRNDLHDLVYTKARQLQALLAYTYGCDEEEGFRNMSLAIQDTYLWACSDMADEIVASLEKLMNLRPAQLTEKEVSHV